MDAEPKKYKAGFYKESTPAVKALFQEAEKALKKAGIKYSTSGYKDMEVRYGADLILDQRLSFYNEDNSPNFKEVLSQFYNKLNASMLKEAKRIVAKYYKPTSVGFEDARLTNQVLVLEISSLIEMQ